MQYLKKKHFRTVLSVLLCSITTSAAVFPTQLDLFDASENKLVIDLTSKKLLNDVCLDLATMGKANPWSVKCSPDSRYLVVTHAGSNYLSLFNYPDFIDTLVANTSRGNDLSHDFVVIHKLRKLVEVTTRGPRALAIVGNNAYTAGYFDDSSATMEEFEMATTSKIAYEIGESQLQILFSLCIDTY